MLVELYQRSPQNTRRKEQTGQPLGHTPVPHRHGHRLNLHSQRALPHRQFNLSFSEPFASEIAYASPLMPPNRTVGSQLAVFPRTLYRRDRLQTRARWLEGHGTGRDGHVSCRWSTTDLADLKRQSRCRCHPPGPSLISTASAEVEITARAFTLQPSCAHLHRAGLLDDRLLYLPRNSQRPNMSSTILWFGFLPRQPQRLCTFEDARMNGSKSSRRLDLTASREGNPSRGV
jgi:hypothetical protein